MTKVPLKHAARSRTMLTVIAMCGLGACGTIGCAPGEQTSTDIGREETQSSSLKTLFGTLHQWGMRVDFTEIVPTNLNVATLAGLTACDTKSLYALTVESAGVFLNYSRDGGETWARVKAKRKAFSASEPALEFDVVLGNPRLACDRSALVAQDVSGGQMLVAKRYSDGHLIIPRGLSTPWKAGSNSVGANQIQGGDGTIYGVKTVTGGRELYRSSTAESGTVSWTGPIATIGADAVTGAGSPDITNSLAWPRRAFALQPDRTVLFNDAILAGQNVWRALDTGNERFVVISAAAPDLLYGIENKGGASSNRLVMITMDETNCTDSVDNDADGRRDAEDDPYCVRNRANAYCAGKPNGSYCIDRFTPATYLGQPNQNPAIIRCVNGALDTNAASAVRWLSCKRHANPSVLGQDSPVSSSEMAGSDPSGMGRWCNRIYPDGSWDLVFGGTDPCGSGDTNVVRAGLYSTTSTNHVYVSCDDGAAGPFSGVGSTPLQVANNTVGHTRNRCVFTASPANLPIFARPFPLEQQGAGVPGNGFQHAHECVQLSQFGHGETATSAGCASGWSNEIDRFGKHVGTYHPAYDLNLAEGVPVYAVRAGTVPSGGARDWDVSVAQCGGDDGAGNAFGTTTFQTEVFVEHRVGSNAKYQETFALYYSHLRRRLVVPGQTVRRGQILGYVGRTGCAGGVHLHLAGYRNSNSNLHKTTCAGVPAALDCLKYGWHLDFQIVTDLPGNNLRDFNSMDPLGWSNNAAFDPWAYKWRSKPLGLPFVGVGGWSPNLFIAGEAYRDF